MKVLLITCLLSALLPAVGSLTCYRCAGEKEACSNAIETQCVAEEDGCASVSYAVFFADSEHLAFSEKKCAQSKSWHSSSVSIATANRINFAAKGQICQTDLCNMEDVTPAHRSAFEENGRKCSAFITFNSENYMNDSSVPCRGDETKCLYVGGSIETSEYTAYHFELQGCATPGACKMLEGNMQAARGVFTANFTHLKCTDAPVLTSTLEVHQNVASPVDQRPWK